MMVEIGMFGPAQVGHRMATWLGRGRVVEVDMSSDGVSPGEIGLVAEEAYVIAFPTLMGYRCGFATNSTASTPPRTGAERLAPTREAAA